MIDLRYRDCWNMSSCNRDWTVRFQSSRQDQVGADNLALSAIPAGMTPISREQMRLMVDYVMNNPGRKTADVLGDVSSVSCGSSDIWLTG